MPKKYMPILSVVLLLATFVSLWRFPSAIPAIGSGLLFFSLAVAISSIFKKQREAYLQGKITRTIFARNVSVEIFAVLLAMTLAGLFGRHIAQIAIEHISNDITKLIAGILIGLLAGMGVGLFVSRVWGKLSTKLNSIHQ